MTPSEAPGHEPPGAREAHDRDYATVVVSDCCAGLSGEEHRNTLFCMQRFAQIRTAAEIDFAG
jgi:nicotinamidase-related amidase